MKVVLCAVNAKYIHSNLAVLYLAEVGQAAGFDCVVREFSINQPPGYMLSEISHYRPAVVAFSCYIWNIEIVLKLCDDLKMIDPSLRVVLGGPEVSYRATDILHNNPSVDYVVSGEGEEVWPELLHALSCGQEVPDGSAVYASSEDYQEGNRHPAVVSQLDQLPFPYRSVSQIKGRIIYFESSRGCPFKCGYCISSMVSGVRFLSLQRVTTELEYLNALQPMEIKFVDRTFNCDLARARTIMEFIAQLPGETLYHMEISPQMLNDNFVAFLAGLPKGRFAFEIGVQTTHAPTLRAVNRSGDWDKICEHIQRIRKADNIHLHLDLIAALPEEGFARFGTSFNQVYKLRPHHLQLGFLKMLPGTALRSAAEVAGAYKFQHHTPYEVLSSEWLSYEELVKLHHIEDVLERYHNAGLAELTIAEVITRHFDGDAFRFWEDLGRHWHNEGHYGVGVGVSERFSILKRFLELRYPESMPMYDDVLKFDVLTTQPAFKLPAGLVSTPECSEQLNQLLKERSFVERYLPEFIDRSVREIKKLVIMERFEHLPSSLQNGTEYVLFVYAQKGQPARRVVRISAGDPPDTDMA